MSITFLIINHTTISLDPFLQASQSAVEWVVALYDFAGNSEGDLSFQQGDYIQISRHIDSDWSSGQLDGREGIFPRAYVESRTGTLALTAVMEMEQYDCISMFHHEVVN